MSSPQNQPYDIVHDGTKGVSQSQSWQPVEEWQPSEPPTDPHQDEFSTGPFTPGENPPNVVATPGPFSRSKQGF